MSITTVSPNGAAFTGENEGTVLHYYRDAGGVGTIGQGFTMLSKAFAAYWLKTRGHALRKGDTISRDECATVLKAIMDAEYAPAVARKLPDADQKTFDAAADTTYNCGAGTLKDRWAASAAKGDLPTAAALLKQTRITAGGRRLAGLVTRRARAAKLMLTGDYGHGTLSAHQSPAAMLDDPAVRQYQTDLAELGYYLGKVDGNRVSSDAAVRRFQKDRGLQVDGVVGPATRAAIKRALDARVVKQATAATAAAGPSGTAVVTSTASGGDPNAILSLHTLAVAGEVTAAALVVIGLAFLAWRYRGVILRKRTPA